MKKAISIFISIILLATTILSGSLSAFAENTTKYWGPRPNCQDTIACVNDKEYSDDIKMSYNNDSEQFAISYNGKGVVTNWEFPLSQENKDYKIISQSNNTIYIKLINKTQELPYINAIVDFRESTTTQSTGQTGNNSTAESNKTEEKTSEIITTDITGTAKTEATSQSTKNAGKETDNKNRNQIIISVIIVCITVFVLAEVILNKKRRN